MSRRKSIATFSSGLIVQTAGLLLWSKLLPLGEGAGGEGRLDVDEALVAAAAEA